MKIPEILEPPKISSKAQPLCPVFGICGGCAYQDISYPEELRIKEDNLRQLLHETLGLKGGIVEPIVSSPDSYHYRSHLDLTLLRTKTGDFFMGFMPEGRFQVVSIDSCAVAQDPISSFLPELKRQAEARLPADYRLANLVVKTGGDGKVRWGGIGKKSLRLEKEDYFFTEVSGKKIFYSLDAFFQANLSILPLVISRLRQLIEWNRQTLFLDLYSGVGLFGICLADRVGKVVMIEECAASVELARFNVLHHGLTNVEIRPGKVENELPNFGRPAKIHPKSQSLVALVDPPRKGLSPAALDALAGAAIHSLLYLSCSPQSLARDLAVFVRKGWRIERVIPFDFFPKTKHLETLVLLKL